MKDEPTDHDLERLENYLQLDQMTDDELRAATEIIQVLLTLPRHERAAALQTAMARVRRTDKEQLS